MRQIMDYMDKLAGWLQVVASVLLMGFTLISIVKTLAQRPETFYFVCFVAMLILSWKLLRVSVDELRGNGRKGGE